MTRKTAEWDVTDIIFGRPPGTFGGVGTIRFFGFGLGAPQSGIENGGGGGEEERLPHDKYFKRSMLSPKIFGVPSDSICSARGYQSLGTQAFLD